MNLTFLVDIKDNGQMDAQCSWYIEYTLRGLEIFGIVWNLPDLFSVQDSLREFQT